MSKYAPLTEWLRRQLGNTVELTFARIEGIIHSTLPPSARKNFTSWANWSTQSWVEAGWGTVMVDMEHEKVKFQRK